MQPRQRLPLQGRIGPYMMGPGAYSGNNTMMNSYGGGQMFGASGPFQGGSPMMRQQMMGRQRGRRSNGGLLSKILGGKNQGARTGGFRSIQSAGRSASGGSGGMGSILQTLSNPESLSGILNNTQQVLKTAQSIGPMIQQYGPLVKNIPMMWKLYKGFKDLPSGETTEENTSESPFMEEESVPEQTMREEESAPEETFREENVQTEAPVQRRRRHSVPKLYV